MISRAVGNDFPFLVNPLSMGSQVARLLQKPLPLGYMVSVVLFILGLAVASRTCAAHRGILEATLSGVLGGFNVTLTKGLLAIIVAGLDDLVSLLTSWILYALAVGLLLAYVMELVTMSASLKREEAAMPILSLIVICEESCTLVGGLLVYEEWHLYSTSAAVCIAFGNSLAVLAVFLMCKCSERSTLIEGDVIDPMSVDAFLCSNEILITVDDVGSFLSNISNGLGLWVNIP